MWTELAKEDQSTSLLYQNTLFSQFYKATWDPAVDSICMCYIRLNNIRLQVEGTKQVIIETEVK
jgi:hypothetical protein